MKRFIITTVIIIGLTIGLTASANSVNFDIQFDPDPLFGNTSFMPGDRVTGLIQVTNKTDGTYPPYIWATEISDKDGLGDVLYLTITKGGVGLHNETLAEFFSRDLEYLENYVKLPGIAAGDTVTYILEIYFEDQSGNKYQEKSVGFDIGIGFEGPEGEILITHRGGGGGGGYAPTPTPTPTVPPTPTPDGRGGDNSDQGGTEGPEGIVRGDTTGTVRGDDDEKASPSEEFTSSDNLLAMFSFWPCGYWLLILLLALIVLTALDKGYEGKRKLYMLLILIAALILAALGYIPCGWWIPLIIVLALAYIVFRKRNREDYSQTQ